MRYDAGGLLFEKRTGACVLVLIYNQAVFVFAFFLFSKTLFVGMFLVYLFLIQV